MRQFERYIVAEVARPFIAVATILVFVFAVYTAGRYLNEAAAGRIGLDVVLQITGYRILIALEVLIPVALYVAVILGLGRLYNDHEMSAAAAMGVSPGRIYAAVATVAVPVAIAVAIISLYGRPWAYASVYAVQARAESDLNVNRLQGGRFNVNAETGRMILPARIDREQARLEEVIIYSRGATRSSLIVAEQARLAEADPARPVLELTAGTGYQLQRTGPEDRILRFQRATLHLAPLAQALEYRRKAAPSDALGASDALPDRAELQWRLSRGPVALLLALLAVPLSRSPPRRGRFANLLPVTVVYAATYYAGGIVRTLVGNAGLTPLPGMWWVPLLMAAALAALATRELRVGPWR